MPARRLRTALCNRVVTRAPTHSLHPNTSRSPTPLALVGNFRPNTENSQLGFLPGLVGNVRVSGGFEARMEGNVGELGACGLSPSPNWDVLGVQPVSFWPRVQKLWQLGELCDFQ